MSELYKLTNQVKGMVGELRERFEGQEGPADRNDHDFFQKVKTETKPMFHLNDQWREAAEEFVKNKQVSVHPNQVKSTHENIELLILHSYYVDVKKKRYNELHHSVHYVMDMLLNDWYKMKRDH